MQAPTMRELLQESLKDGVDGASQRLRARLVASNQRRRAEASAYQTGVSDISIRIDKDRNKRNETRADATEEQREAAAALTHIPATGDASPLDAHVAFLESKRPGLVKYSLRQTNTEGESTLAALIDGSKFTPEEAVLYEDMHKVIDPYLVKDVRVGEPLIHAIEELHRTMTPHCYVWTPLLLLLNSGSDYTVDETSSEPRATNTTGRNALIQAAQLMDYFTFAIAQISRLRTELCNKVDDESQRKQEEENLEQLRAEFNATEQVRQDNYNKLQTWALEALFGKGSVTIPAHIPSFTDVWGDLNMDPERMITEDLARQTCAGSAVSPSADKERVRLLAVAAQRRRTLRVIATQLFFLTLQRCHNLCRSLCQFMGVTPKEAEVWGVLGSRAPAPDKSWTWPRGGFTRDFGYAGLLRNLKELETLHPDHDKAAIEAALAADKDLIVGTAERAPMEDVLSGESLSVAWCYWALVLTVLAQKSRCDKK